MVAEGVRKKTQAFWDECSEPPFSENGRLNLLAGWLQCCERFELMTHDEAQGIFESLDDTGKCV